MIARIRSDSIPVSETSLPPQRKVIHVDMDAFFASVEQRDDPSLRGRPVAVGGEGERSVVAAASYEARRFGVRSAMPSVVARRKCRDLVFVRPRFEVYRAVSQQIREVFLEHTHLVEPLSLDEAYLDVTQNLQGIPTATEVAERVRAEIFARTGLTASAGVSYNKFLAKMASGMNKPNGQYLISPRAGEAFVADLDIGRFHGIGERTAERMRQLGIHNGADLRSKPLEFLAQHFGVNGQHFFRIARGVDERPVNPDRIRKSIGAENTFTVDLTGFEEIMAELEPLAAKVWAACERIGTKGRKVSLKLRFTDFETIDRGRSVPAYLEGRDAILAVAESLLKAELPLPRPIRLVGVTLSSLLTAEEPADDRQLTLDLA